MHAADQLLQAAVIVILDHFGLELHVLLESGIGPHAKLACIELETDIDDSDRLAQEDRNI